MVDWERVAPEFLPTERWGDIELIRPELVYALHAFRLRINTPIVVSYGTQGQHAEDSEHYTGHAVDVVIPKVAMDGMLDLFIEATRFPFTSIGLYTYWRYEKRLCPGMHLGIEPRDVRKYWIRIEDATGLSDWGMTLKSLRWLGLV